MPFTYRFIKVTSLWFQFDKVGQSKLQKYVVVSTLVLETVAYFILVNSMCPL